MKRIFFSLLLCSTLGSANAADLIKLSASQGIPSPSLLQKQSTPALKEIKKLNKHTRYQQLIDGIPVFGHHVIYHNNKKGYYTGHWVSLSSKEKSKTLLIQPLLTADDALNLAKQDFQTVKQPLVNAPQYHNQKATLNYYLNDAKQLKKVYLVTFFADAPNGKPARPYYLIDATTKEIIKYWDGLTTQIMGTGPGGNEKTGRYQYGVNYPMLDVALKEDNTTCEMSSPHVETINLNHAEDPSNNDSYQYVCPDNSNDEINGAYSPLNDAHFFGGVIFDMYQDWYHIAPLSFKLKMKVHFGNNFENAFWDGTSMTFGDGGEIFYPLVALDVAAHEISHGVTEQNSGLQYWGQSGGLNESFSDMAGKAAEFYSRGKNKWNMGADITKGSRPLRYMNRPERDGNSIGDARDFEPSLDVHYSSGVFNRLFYTLATTKGWDTRKAFDVMLSANQHYWEPETDFYQAAEGVLQATKDLTYNVDDVLNALQTVGISCVQADSDYLCQQSPD